MGRLVTPEGLYRVEITFITLDLSVGVKDAIGMRNCAKYFATQSVSQTVKPEGLCDNNTPC